MLPAVDAAPIVVLAPLQIDTSAPALSTGCGFTIIVVVIALPTQKVGVGPVGVMVKVTVTAEVVVLVKATPVMFPAPLAAIPVTSVVLSLVHAKVVDATELLVPKVMVVNPVPEQIV